MNIRPSLPLSLECWNSITLPRTQYNQYATNFLGRRNIRQPLLESQIVCKPTNINQNNSILMKRLQVAPKFR